MRPTVSPAPPAALGTTMRIGRLGYAVCECASCTNALTNNASAAAVFEADMCVVRWLLGTYAGLLDHFRPLVDIAADLCAEFLRAARDDFGTFGSQSAEHFGRTHRFHNLRVQPIDDRFRHSGRRHDAVESAFVEPRYTGLGNSRYLWCNRRTL